MSAAIEVKDLQIRAAAGLLVRDVSFTIRPGEILVVMGETGSGKSLVAQAVMGTLPSELSATGEIRIEGKIPEDPRALWGRRIALLPQEPWLALDPTMRIEKQVALSPALVEGNSWLQAGQRARQALDRLGLAASRRAYPFELSGGMAQRAAYAATTVTDAPILIADEPTKGLDAARRNDIADQMRALVMAGAAVMVITHDIALAQRLGGRMQVMLAGEIIESGQTANILTDPQHVYTKALLAADPSGWIPLPGRATQPVIEGRGLSKSLGGSQLFDGLNVSVGSGEIVAVSGPSGCGKTTLGNILLGVVKPGQGVVVRKTAPSVKFQKIYQDPVAAFAPAMTLRQALMDVCRLHRVEWSAAAGLLAAMGVGEDLLERRPGAVSGGELQRIALTRALLVEPHFLFADEATSRLDPLTQAEVMRLLRRLVEEREMAVLLVTHDPAIAKGMAARTMDLAA
jgi:peptide/nickel transport system ATP-binding protein